MSGRDTIVELRGVRHVFRREREPVGLSFQDLDLARGEHAVVVGPSGSGKTTLLHLLAGLLVASAGTVRVAGRDLATLSEAGRDRYRAASVGYVFQDFHLIDGYTALENVVVGLGLAGVRGADRVGRARRALERLGLGARLHHLPRRLSTGERQRVALARAVAPAPSLLLADEPTAHLDRARASDAMALLREVAVDLDAVLLVATHDPWVVEGFERRLVMQP
jgi:putative ABC transport system ATP-binding protein